jgi:hypothetical protein
LQNDKEDKNQKKYKAKKATGHKQARKKDIWRALFRTEI